MSMQDFEAMPVKKAKVSRSAELPQDKPAMLVLEVKLPREYIQGFYTSTVYFVPDLQLFCKDLKTVVAFSQMEQVPVYFAELTPFSGEEIIKLTVEAIKATVKRHEEIMNGDTIPYRESRFWFRGIHRSIGG